MCIIFWDRCWVVHIPFVSMVYTFFESHQEGSTIGGEWASLKNPLNSVKSMAGKDAKLNYTRRDYFESVPVVCCSKLKKKHCCVTCIVACQTQYTQKKGGARCIIVIVVGRWHVFKSWTRRTAFNRALIPLRKVWIQLFSLQQWVNSWADWGLQPWWGK